MLADILRGIAWGHTDEGGAARKELSPPSYAKDPAAAVVSA